MPEVGQAYERAKELCPRVGTSQLPAVMCGP